MAVKCNSTETYRMKCEVRQWKAWVKEKGRVWWDLEKDRIKNKRGQAGLDKLLQQMNRG